MDTNKRRPLSVPSAYVSLGLQGGRVISLKLAELTRAPELRNTQTKSVSNLAVRKCRSVVAASRIPRCFMQAKLVQSVKENGWSS